MAGVCLAYVVHFALLGNPTAMRLLMLCGTAMWIANNVIAGSIGGTVLEVVVALVNASTILRLYRVPESAI